MTSLVHDPIADIASCAVSDPDIDGPLTVAEVAERLGVSGHTLRYYERVGLVHVARDASGYRAYDADAISRVVFLTRMRLSGMPIRELQRYVAMVEAGDSTVPQRLALLERHRDTVMQQIEDLQAALEVTNYKIRTYGGECGS